MQCSSNKLFLVIVELSSQLQEDGHFSDISKLVEHMTSIGEVMGSSPVPA